MNHKGLDVWKIGMDLVVEVYHFCKQLPAEEKFGLSSQIKGSAVSVPSNIAEGCGRKSDKELVRFIHIALGSLAELETQLLISQRLGFQVPPSIFDKITSTTKLALGLRKYILNK